MRYSIEHRDQMFVEGHIYLSFARRMGKFISKNISIYLSGKYILLQMRLKLHQTEQLKKTAKVTDNLIGSKIADKITNKSLTPTQIENPVENLLEKSLRFCSYKGESG